MTQFKKMIFLCLFMVTLAGNLVKKTLIQLILKSKYLSNADAEAVVLVAELVGAGDACSIHLCDTSSPRINLYQKTARRLHLIAVTTRLRTKLIARRVKKLRKTRPNWLIRALTLKSL